MSKPQPRLEFPCDFPLKVIGIDQADLVEHITAIVLRHVPDLLRENVTSQVSSHGKYRSVNFQFLAQSRAQVDALYRDLSDDPLVKMLL